MRTQVRILVVKSRVIILPLLIGVAYLTLAERKVMSSIQRRQGPNVVGMQGLFTPLADGLKRRRKESILPTSANIGLFLFAPVLTFSLALVGWSVIPVGDGMVYADVNRGVIYMFAISALAVYGIMRAGQSSNSKYAFLGALRSAAQMVSYEVSIGFIVVCVRRCAGTTNRTGIVKAQENIQFMFPLFPMFRMFFVSALAETNRHPFDLPEAEAELVAGYNVEYSSMGFARFFLGEYGNMILMSSITSILFRGGQRAPISIAPFSQVPGAVQFGIKTIIFLIGFIIARAAYPRYRYDQLMRLGQKVFLPVSMGYVRFTSGLLIGRNGLPA